MPLSQQHIDSNTPMGAALIPGGATFRVWAPGAREVYLVRNAHTSYTPDPADRLVKNPATGHFTGFAPDVVDGLPYRYWVVGDGDMGWKRDPYACELHYLDGLVTNDYENSNCIVRNADSYSWVATDHRPPRFHELVVYQLHIGVFYARDRLAPDGRGCTARLLDAAERIPYLADLGINAIQALPFVEFWSETSRGYNGTDLFSPEMDYCLDASQLDASRLARINALLTARGAAPKTVAELAPHTNQLKLFVDLCHLYGIAVLIDVVFNHAGGGFNAQSIRYFDRPKNPTDANDLYFDPRGASWAGGRVFDYQKPDVRELLLNNLRRFLERYRVDGIRYDEVRVIDWNGGWTLLQDMTNTVRFIRPDAVQIAEYWGDARELAVKSPPNGMGFDLAYDDRLRDAVRAVLVQAAGGRDANVDVGLVANALAPRPDFGGSFRHYNCLENHDLEDDAHDEQDKKPRIARLAGGDDPRSWYATSRARVANAWLLTAPGTPMLFMGQEFLEEQYWSDNPNRKDLWIDWNCLERGDRVRVDFHRFMRDLCWLRRNEPALCGEGLHVFHVQNDNRVLAYHRWDTQRGRDLVIVTSLSERSYDDRSYQLGFPIAGHWDEIFNSDIYENFFNPAARGNYGGVAADGPALHDLPCSAAITIPANSVLVFARAAR
jgi:1,4-alpha-glucan branching enzyme